MSDELMIFVGAGCSIEAGLPDWKALAVSYINEAVSGPALPQDLPDRFGDPRRLAIIADAMLGDFKRFRALSNALYPGQRAPAPGPTAQEIAKLYRARLAAGLHTYIVTTNFDPLLEMALDTFVVDPSRTSSGDTVATQTRSVGLADRFPIVTESPDDNPESSKGQVDSARELFTVDPSGIHVPVVFHLHGAIDLRDPNHPIEIDPIFLSERDYARWERLAQTALLELLKDTPCLMVGLGLEDNDVTTVLYAQMTGHEKIGVPPELRRERIVVAFNPVQEIHDDAPAAEKVVEQVRKLENRRLDKLGVKRLRHLKNFAQIPQVLHEMGLALTLARERDPMKLVSDTYFDSDSPYDQRLDRWKRDFAERYLDDAEFEKQQQAASQRCQEALAEIVSAVEDKIGHPIEDELAIHVWARSQEEEDGPRMFPWCCNEFARRGAVPESLSRGIVNHKTDVALLQAFQGVPSRRLKPAAEHSRWRQIFAVPVISAQDEATHQYGRLLVGVVSISTNRGEEESDLGEGLSEHDELTQEAVRCLEELGKSLLLGM